MSIKIENIVGPSVRQWKSVIMAMRNPMNSWEKSDSDFYIDYSEDEADDMEIGSADMELMKRLAKAGSDHRKFARMLPVIMDVTAPLYWWKEADTYKVGTVANSCSTMHKIAEKEFTRDDFSREHLFDWMGEDGESMPYCAALDCEADGSLVNRNKYPLDLLDETIFALNFYREKFLETKDKRYWWQMIQLLPSSYNQKRTWFLNYEVLWNIYQARKGHKLDEWREFCETIVCEVPYFKEIFISTEE